MVSLSLLFGRIIRFQVHQRDFWPILSFFVHNWPSNSRLLGLKRGFAQESKSRSIYNLLSTRPLLPGKKFMSCCFCRAWLFTSTAIRNQWLKNIYFFQFFLRRSCLPLKIKTIRVNCTFCKTHKTYYFLFMPQLVTKVFCDILQH
jgi:hypothetical protein